MWVAERHGLRTASILALGRMAVADERGRRERRETRRRLVEDWEARLEQGEVPAASTSTSRWPEDGGGGGALGNWPRSASPETCAVCKLG